MLATQLAKTKTILFIKLLKIKKEVEKPLEDCVFLETYGLIT